MKVHLRKGFSLVADGKFGKGCFRALEKVLPV
jgi:hypothetical protein